MTLEIAGALIFLILSGISTYFFYLLRTKEEATIKQFKTLQERDERQQEYIESLKELIQRQTESIMLNDQRDRLDLKLIDKEIEIVKNDVRSLKEGIDQKITLVNVNIERILSRMDKQDEWFREQFMKK